MVKVGVAEYDVQLSRAALQAEVAGASRDIEAGLGASARQVGAEFTSAAKTALKGFVAFKGAEFAKDAIAGAVSLAQQQQRANVEFGDGVKIVDEFAAHADKGAGLSERAALQAASAYGTMFHAIGVGGVQSAQMSTKLVQLSADFAALHGTSQEAAVQAIQRGLGGMGRGLRQYGIFLTDANLKQEATTLGLYKGTGALDQAAKTQAAYSLIVKGGASANGAFANSTNSLLGQQKQLSAEWDNAKDKIGQSLVPAMKSGVVVGTDLLGVFDHLPGALRETIIFTGAAAGVAKLFGGSLTGVVKSGASAVASLAGMGAAGAETAAAATDAETLAAASLLTAKAIQTEQAEAIKLAGALAIVGKSTGGLIASQTAEDIAAAGVENANVLASQAFIAEQAAAADLVAALQAVGASADDVSLATTGMTVAEADAAAAEQAAAAAAAEQEAANAGLLASLGPIGIALGVLGAAYAAFKLSSGGGKITGDASALLGATRKELVGFAAAVEHFKGEKGFEEIGRKSLPALKLMRDAVKATGGDTTDMDRAIRVVTASSERAARNEAKYGDAVGTTSTKTKEATDDVRKYTQAVIDGASAAVTKAQDIEAAKFAEQDTSTALIQAIRDEATARRAAAGDSDEYRAAEAAIVRDKESEAKAAKDVATAERDLSAAREQASRSLRDERLDSESAVIAAERARLALEDSKDALAKTQDDPRATARQKEQALLDEKDAEIALQQAQNHRGDSAADLAKAEAAGVDGAPGVVAAKQQVADAIKAQGDAEAQTASDTKAAAKVISDAKDNERAASVKVRQAVLDEAGAQEQIAQLAYGAAAGHDAFNASLLRSVAMLDPNSPLRKELEDYAGQLADLALLESSAIGFPNQQGHAVGQGELTNRPQGAPHAPGTAGRSLGHPGKTINIGTVNTRNGATAAEVANELAFGHL